MPDGFRFAVKLPLTRLDRVTPFLERVAALGDRLGPIRVVVEAARDEGLVTFVAGSAPPGAELAWDFRHESWATAAPKGVVRVDDPAAEPFRYLRLREPPYTDADLQRVRRDGARARRTSTSATRTSRPRRPTRRACASSSNAASAAGPPARAAACSGCGGGFESTSTAAASSTAMPTRLSPEQAPADASGEPRRLRLLEPRPHEEVVDAAPRERDARPARSSRAAPARSPASRGRADAAAARC